MPHYLLLCLSGATALLAPVHSTLRQPLTAKAATEGAEIPYELCCQALHRSLLLLHLAADCRSTARLHGHWMMVRLQL